MNSILRPPFRQGVLNADLIIEPSDADESQTQRFRAAQSAECAEVGDRITNAANFPGSVDQLPDPFRGWRDKTICRYSSGGNFTPKV